MLSELQTIDAFGAPATEYTYDAEVLEDVLGAEDDDIVYRSVDAADLETGLRLILVVVSHDDNRIRFFDVLTTSKVERKAVLQAGQVVYLEFPPQDYTIVNYWVAEDTPF
ncbi:MAG: hypothetical protein N4J56_001747 [Chroococcidiopsis sp. SAG 2025]|nr:hypothetical protein [Chroococcidiopsis sp. SAG 2025]